MTEIADLIERMYGHHYTPQTVSNMTNVMLGHIEAFTKRSLARRYVCVYLHATYLAVKRDTVTKKAVHLAVGIREDGSKEVLAYTLAPTESAFVWKELLHDIRERGAEDSSLWDKEVTKGVLGSNAEVEDFFKGLE